MSKDPIHIYGRDINPEKIFLIKPYDPIVLDLRTLPYEDINSVLVLARRPFRMLARRPVRLLAAMLGFHYLPDDNLAVNPRMQTTVEAHSGTNFDALHYRSIMKVTYHGVTRRHMLQTPPEDVQAILQIDARRASLGMQPPLVKRAHFPLL
ncbi:MAG: hypothetical protein EKK41_07355 [Hyphomicrobiales bacterium]|nr:MAG: hypothetical protein EKK41_07355 [Hyphomicrobiales bacterium]